MGQLEHGAAQTLLGALDSRDVGMDNETIRKYGEDECAAKLAHLRAHCIGNFKTHVRCHCPAHVIDHATEHDPDAPHSLRDVLTGVGLTAREQVAAFRPHHRYWCDACGLKYEASVIEGSKGWVPHERRPEFTK